jgi:N-terminal domain of galactosyltransferase
LTVKPRVCVVLPLFGGHRAVQVVGTVVAAWLAQDVPCEVVVAVAGEVPAGLPDGARVVPADPAVTSPGVLRNLGASSTEAPLLYLGDADIVPLGTDFLARALRLRGDHVVVQPWMYRLVNAAELAELPQWQQPSRPGRVCLVTGDASGRLTPVPGERFHRTKAMLMVEPPPELADPLDSPDLALRAPYHWGGTLVERGLFEEVGGYCPGYTGWGCEDDDLLVKLAARTALIRAWIFARTLTCLHFEHPRPYAGPGLQANRDRYARRTAAGAEAMIAADRAGNDRTSALDPRIGETGFWSTPAGEGAHR